MRKIGTAGNFCQPVIFSTVKQSLVPASFCRGCYGVMYILLSFWQRLPPILCIQAKMTIVLLLILYRLSILSQSALYHFIHQWLILIKFRSFTLVQLQDNCIVMACISSVSQLNVYSQLVIYNFLYHDIHPNFVRELL